MKRKNQRRKRQQLQQAVLEMLDAGHSRPSVMNRLGLNQYQLNAIVRELGITGVVAPEGYVSLDEAAKRIRVPLNCIWHAVWFKELRVVSCDGHLYTRHEWVDIWRNTTNYRKKANEMQRRLFRDRSKPVQSPDPEP
jgi:hypothetical protein